MRAWRLTRPLFAGALDGEGARLYGGRWNSPGLPMVYCAGSPSLAILETFVHLPAEQRSPADLPLMILLTIDVPDEAVSPSDEVLRPGLVDEAESRLLGDAWLRSGSSLAMVVRSAVVPFEINVLLNPAHPDMRRVVVASRDEYRFDPRMAAPDEI